MKDRKSEVLKSGDEENVKVDGVLIECRFIVLGNIYRQGSHVR